MSDYQFSIKNLYTKRRQLYNFFITSVGYKAAVKKFFNSQHYIRANMRVLDAGCGTGLITKILYHIAKKNNLPNIVFNGFDITPAMLEVFQKWINKNKISNIQLRRADVLKTDKLPTHWQQYNLITASGMLEHLKRTKIIHAIKNLKKLLAPGGTLVIIICRKNFLAYWIIYKWWQAEIYTQDEIKTIMHDAGFNTISFKQFSFPYNYLNNWVHIVQAIK